MAGSLRRKKRARASAGKKTHRVGVTTNFAKGRARVDTAAVELPGAGATESWDVDATLTKNYSASGLASDPNARAEVGGLAAHPATEDARCDSPRGTRVDERAVDARGKNTPSTPARHARAISRRHLRVVISRCASGAGAPR